MKPDFEATFDSVPGDSKTGKWIDMDTGELVLGTVEAGLLLILPVRNILDPFR